MKDRKKKYTTIISFILGSVLAFCSNAGQLLIPEAVSLITTSAETDARSSGYNMIDGDTGTFWKLSAGAQAGRVEITLDDNYTLEKLVLNGENLQENDILLDFYSDGHWRHFFTCRDLPVTIDLAEYRITTDRLALYIEGPTSDTISMRELELSGCRASLQLDKIIPSRIKTTDNVNFFYYSTNLMDGNLESDWRTTAQTDFGPGGNTIRTELQQAHTAELFHECNSNNGITCFHLDRVRRVDYVQVYLTNSLNSDVLIYVNNNGSWHFITMLPKETGSGWHRVRIPAIYKNTALVQVKMIGNTTEMQGIGEVEIWGYGQWDQQVSLSLGSAPQPPSSTNRVFVFQTPKIATYRLFLQIAGQNSALPSLELNGFSLDSGEVQTIPGGQLMIQPIDRTKLQSGNNTLQVIPAEEDSVEVLSALLVEASPKETKTLLLNGSGDETFPLHENSYLQQVFSDAEPGTSLILKVETGGQWQTLNVDPSTPYVVEAGLTGSILRVLYTPGEITTLTLSRSETGSKLALQLLNPLPGMILTFDELYAKLIYGWVSEPTAQVMVNGQTCNMNGHIFWIAADALNIVPTSSQLVLDINVRDGARGFGEWQFTYPLEWGLNEFYEIFPEEDFIHTAAAQLRIYGTIPGDTTQIVINDQVVTANGNNFSIFIDLVEGYNNINIRIVETVSGKTLKYLRKQVLRTSEDAGFRIEFPVNNYHTNQESFIVSGTVTHTTGVSVEVNGTVANLSCSRFLSQPVHLEEGTNILTLELKQDGVTQATRLLTVSRDSEAPVLRNILPAGGGMQNIDQVIVSGNLSDNSPCWLSLNNKPCFPQSGSFSETVKLAQGVQEIVVMAVDAAGNSTSVTIGGFFIDTIPPASFELNVDPSGYSNDNTPELSYTTTDNGSGIDHAELSLNQGTFTPFVASPGPLADGEYTATVRVFDVAGNVQSASVCFTVDTVAPAAPAGFRVVSEPGKATLRWEAPEENLLGYDLIRYPAWLDGTRRVTAEVYEDIEIDTETAYIYQLTAIDLAGNTSATVDSEITIPGMEYEEYNRETGNLIEYGNAVLVIEPASLPAEVKKIVVTEIESAELVDKAINPVISPIYNFSVIMDDGGEEKIFKHTSFSKEFLGSLNYDQQQVPEGFPEENLGVYYYDTIWCRWFKIPGSYVDTEKDMIFFKSNHFSDFSIQPTLIEDQSPQELMDSGYTPFKSVISHSDINVSTQGGSVSTEMTEFVLPGRNGFDLAIKRTYDSAVARGDASGLVLNAAVGINFLNPTSITAELVSLGKNICLGALAQYETKLKQLIQNQGDYCYSMGLGWRLNLPYIRSANGGMLLRMPNGSFVDLHELEINKEQSNFGSISRQLVMESHTEQDFTIKITQLRSDISIANLVNTTEGLVNAINALYEMSSAASTAAGVLGLISGTANLVPDWTIMGAELITNDGTIYTFDVLGRVTSIVSPLGDAAGNDGINKITLVYDKTMCVTIQGEELGLKLDYIEDTMGRRIKFEYEDTPSELGFIEVPRINKIYLEDDVYQREVSYAINNDEFTETEHLLPLLAGATWKATIDSTDYIREFQYHYEEKTVMSLGASATLNLASTIGDLLLAPLFGPIVSTLTGWDNLTLRGNLRFEDIYLLKSMEGPGVGLIDLTNKKIPLVYINGEWTDEFLNLIPTSYEMSFDLGYRMVVDKLCHYTDTSRQTLISELDYDYSFIYAGRKQFYNELTKINNGRRVVAIHYNGQMNIVNQYIDLSEQILDNLQHRFLTTEVYYLKPFNTSTVITDNTSGEILELTEYEWNNEKTKILSQNRWLGPNNTNLIETKYDSWGNAIYTRSYSLLGKSPEQRVSELESWMVYSGTLQTEIDAVFSGSGNPYQAAHDSLNLNRERKDLLLGQITHNHIRLPEAINTVHTYPSHIESKSFMNYDNQGLKVEEATWSEDYGWIKTGYTYDTPSETYGMNDDYSLIGITKNQGTSNTHSISIDYDYNSSPDEYYLTSSQWVTTPAGDNAQLIKTVTAVQKDTGFTLWTKNPRGYVTYMKYDPFGRIVESIAPSETDDSTFDPRTGNFLLTAAHPVTTVNYNDTDWVVTVQKKRLAGEPEKDSMQIYKYNLAGQLEQISHKYYDYSYDPVTGAVERTGTEKEIRTTLTYNRWGEVETISRPLTENEERLMRYEYNSLGHIKKSELVGYTWEVDRGSLNNNYTWMNYTPSNNSTKTINELGHISEVLTDLQDQTVETRVYNGGELITTKTYYDSIGNVLITLDQEGRMVISEYNELNQLTRKILPDNDSLVADYGFWEADSILQGVQPTVEYTYTADGVLKEESHGHTGMANEDKLVITYTADEVGRVYRTTRSRSRHLNPAVIPDRDLIDVTNTASLDWSTSPQKIEIQSEVYYDENGNQLRVIDTRGREVQCFSYTPRDLISREEIPLGTTTYKYDLQDKILEMTTPLGNVLESDGLTPTYGENSTLKKHYDELGRMVTGITPPMRGQTTADAVYYKYFPNNKVEKKIEYPEGSVTNYTYNKKGLLLSETVRDGVSDNLKYTRSYRYDAAGNVAQQLDNEGNITYSYYDALNRVIRQRTAGTDGFQEEYAYDKIGNKTLVKCGKNYTQTCYDAYNRPYRIVDAQGGEIINWYDTRGNLTRYVNRNGASHLNYYNELGQVVKEVSSYGYEKFYAYDDAGQLIFHKDPRGTKAFYFYDQRDLLEQATLFNGTISQAINYFYDEVGNLMQVSNNGVVTSYNQSEEGYLPDAYGTIYQQKQILEGREFSMTYGFKSPERLTELEYPDGSIVEYNFNSLGQLMGIAGYVEQTPIYDNRGLLEVLEAANGVQRVMHYDAGTRLSALGYEHSGEILKKYNYSYNQENNIKQVNSSQYEYDVLNQLILAELSGDFEVDIESDPQPQLVGTATDDFTGNKELVFTTSGEVLLDYAAASIGVDLQGFYKVSRMKVFPGTLEHRIEKRNLVLYFSLRNEEGAYTRIRDEDWILNYGADGSLELNLRIPVLTAYIKLHCYYDDRDAADIPQANEATVSSTKETLLKVYYMVDKRLEAYVYDSNGNRVSSSIQLDGQAEQVKDYTYYSAVSALGSFSGDRLQSDGTYAYVWDANGNLTAKGTDFTIDPGTGETSFTPDSGEYWEYEYNLLDRMVLVKKSQNGSDPGNMKNVAAYVYNADGLRVKKYKYETGESTFYVYDPSGTLLYEKTEDNGGAQVGFALYVYIEGLLFARVNEKGRFFYHTDHLGSTTMITDENGNIVWQDEISPFGESGGSTGVLDEMAMYTGKDFDRDVGLYYFNARWYDAGIGRFVSEDPVRDGMNWYVYCSNNPLLFVDPSGMLSDVNRNNFLSDLYHTGGNYTERLNHYQRLESDAIHQLEFRIQLFEKAVEYGVHESNTFCFTEMKEDLENMKHDYYRDIAPDEILLTFDKSEESFTLFNVYKNENENIVYTMVPENSPILGNKDFNDSYIATNNPSANTSNPPPQYIQANYIYGNERYWPQDQTPAAFPFGEWNVTEITFPNNNSYGAGLIKTNAHKLVDTVSYNPDETGNYPETGNEKDDYAYYVHGGGYTNNATYSPTGNNRVQDATHGCVRMQNNDILQIAKYLEKYYNRIPIYLNAAN